jgi:Rieske Fe-S protein
MSEESRRSLLGWLVGGGVFGSLASFLYPVFRFLNPPITTQAPVSEVTAGKASDLKPNSAKIVKFGNKPALLVRTSATEWKAFSAVCTHLNCNVQYDEANRHIWCACHNGLYNMNGAVVSGPPPKPLEEFEVHLRGDEIVIARRA